MRPLIIAFSMYSKIPMPRFTWKETDQTYAMCFFPLVGAAVGVAFIFADFLLSFVHAADVFRGAVLTVFPVLMTGGIHMDGYLDTCDARASFADRERKLEILKDSHVGAFAVIHGCAYFLLLFAAYASLDRSGVLFVSISFVISRALSAIAAFTLPNAREHGMLRDFTRHGAKKTVLCSSFFFLAAAAICMIWQNPLRAAICLAVMLGVFVHYIWFSKKEFGGITGDLAGYFLQNCELAAALSLAVLRFLSI